MKRGPHNRCNSIRGLSKGPERLDGTVPERPPALQRYIPTVFSLAILFGGICGCTRKDEPRSIAVPVEDALQEPAKKSPSTGSLADGLRKGLSSSKAETPPVRNSTFFTEVAEESGIQHTYLNGASGRLLMVEATGGGCGWIDFDRDGLWDLYLTQGGDPALAPSPTEPSDQLFRRTLEGRFETLTPLAGIDERSYSQGIAVGDFDNDGFDDLHIANVGADVLYRNQGDGTFLDVTAQTIGFDKLWSSSSAWGDIDRDGDLDLYVCNYVDFDPKNPRICLNSQGFPSICHPNRMEPVPDECFLNEGDGTFRPIAQERGLFGPGNKALGVAIADFDNDGWPDIYVANDTTANFLFINQKDGTFRESASLLGCGVNANGSPQASMGVTVGDYDENGYLDLYLTHFTQEWNTLYRNLGPQGFQDVTALVGLVSPTLDYLGFGTVMADFDQDGLQELFIANGHIDDQTAKGRDTAMIPQLFSWNGRRFDECTKAAGEFFQLKRVSRGVASCDYDEDGDLDLVVVPQNAPAALLRNDSRRGHWLKLEFVGRRSNRRGIGARATLHLGERRLMQELAGGTSYSASHQAVLIFGLGTWMEPIDVEIRWPDGRTQWVKGVQPDQALRVEEPDAEPETDRDLTSAVIDLP